MQLQYIPAILIQRNKVSIWLRSKTFKQSDTLVKTATTGNKQYYTKLIFPGFIVKLHNVNMHIDGVEMLGDSSKAILHIDKSKNWSFIHRLDTVDLQEVDFYKVVELIPEDKTDIFKVSVSSKVYIREVNNIDNFILSVMVDYKPLNDSLNYFFKIPDSVSNNSNISEIKRKLNLKDTIVKSKGNSYRAVIYKNKAGYIISDDRICLKLERFNGYKLLETKFLTFEKSYGEDAD